MKISMKYLIFDGKNMKISSDDLSLRFSMKGFRLKDSNQGEKHI